MSASRHEPAGAWRTLVQRALDTGEWEKTGTDGQNHAGLRHIPTGQTTGYATGGDSCSDRNGVRNFAKDVKRISGHDIWQRSSRKPSRKKVVTSGYQPVKSDNERTMSAEINRLLAELRVTDNEIRHHPKVTRQDFSVVRSLLGTRAKIVDRLAQLHQPAPDLELGL